MLSILPIILLLIQIMIQHARGEYYLYFNYDGPYAYLIGSLNIADFDRPGYFQHPGIIPQLIIASIIKFSHFLQGNDPSVVMDTFNRPEFYFNRINIVFAFINSISLYYFGKIVFKKTGEFWTGLFLQFTPFISILLIYNLASNTVYSVILVYVFILLTLIISFVNEDNLNRKKYKKYILFFGITCGLLISTLISLLPFFILPFLLIRKFKDKLYFIIISLTTFALLYFTVSSDSSTMWSFVIKNILHSGKYGSGPVNFLDPSMIGPTFNKIMIEFRIYLFIYFMIIITLMLQFIPKLKLKIWNSKYFRTLIGIFVIMSVYILLVAKQMEIYYLIPGVMFSVMALFCINSIYVDLFPRFFKFGKYAYLFFFLILMSFPQIGKFGNYLKHYNVRKKESHKIIKYVKENYPNQLIIASDQTSSLPTAFYYSLVHTGNQTNRYISILNEKFPNYIYFQRYRNEFLYLDKTPEKKQRLINSDSVVFHAFNENNFNIFKDKLSELTNKDITYKEVFANKNGERLYMVYLKPKN